MQEATAAIRRIIGMLNHADSNYRAFYQSTQWATTWWPDRKLVKKEAGAEAVS